MTLLRAMVNGELNSSVSIQDRGLQYGDGLFETIACVNHELPYFDLHWQRLDDSCKRLKINTPAKTLLEEYISKLISGLKNEKLVIKLIVTRGDSERGYAFSGDEKANCILTANEWHEYPGQWYENGIDIHLCQTRLSENASLAGMKHLNRLEQVLARNERDDNQFQEGLMQTEAGNIVDGTMSNLFIVKDDVLYTPDIQKAGVAGVMRLNILNIARMSNIHYVINSVKMDEVLQADEIFLCNSIAGIWPVRSFEGNHFNAPGKVTSQLMQQVKNYN